MPNWCNNWLWVEGDSAKVKKCMNAFAKAKPFDDASVVLTEDVKDGHFFYIETDKDNGSVSYQTKWSPNCEDVRDIAIHFGVTIEHSWEEGGCDCYGRAMYYPNGDVLNLDLDEDVLDEIEEDGDWYVYNGERYESYDEIIENILDKEWDKLLEAQGRGDTTKAK